MLLSEVINATKRTELISSGINSTPLPSTYVLP
jgi:hypothetical protein